MRKSRLKTAVILVAIVTFAVVITLAIRFLRQDEIHNSNYITQAEAAKMIALAADNDNSIVPTGNTWYDKYVSFVNDRCLMSLKHPEDYLTGKDVTYFLNAIGKKDMVVSFELKNDNSIVSKKDFITLFQSLIGNLDTTGTVQTIEAGIVGTPSNAKEATAWQAYTTEGIYNFEGLVLDYAIDKTATMIVKNDKILCVTNVIDGVTYKNVWVENGTATNLKIYAYGIYREFSIKSLTEDISGVLADVMISDRMVSNINIKTDTITGKVLSVTEKYIEIDGYGKVPLDEDYRIYDNYNGFSIKNYTDIVVGYDLQNFIVAQGKICGAIISKPLNADNIRVLVKTSGFESLFHENVILTSDHNFTLYYNDVEEKHAANETVTIEKDNAYLAGGRVKAIADADGSMTILSLKRSQGAPSYEGSIEVSSESGGLVIVNEVLIEKYLKRVVPSEMPTKFGVEALKVQAVCARSYAYKQLTNNNYSQYGAHVDDSTQYQVYNNTDESQNSNNAIADTDGQVLTYANDVVQTYYYSTSCGYTTDVSIWGSSEEDYPYFPSKSVGTTDKELDMTDEQTFRDFITSMDDSDFDRGFPLYRWKWKLSVAELSDSLNAKIGERYNSYPSKILTQNEKGEFVSKSIKSVGNVEAITVNNRVTGGAINCITIKGSSATVRIDGENNIRYLMGVVSVPLITADGGTTTMSSMPSTFCIFDPVYTDSALSGFTITGGGYGHGIGMSQNAVSTMTSENMSYAQILQFFYSGTDITNISNLH